MRRIRVHTELLLLVFVGVYRLAWAFLTHPLPSSLGAQRSPARFETPDVRLPGGSSPAAPRTYHSQLAVSLSTPFLSWRNDTSVSTGTVFPRATPQATVSPNHGQKLLLRKQRKPKLLPQQPVHLFCDLDGVLVDFEHGIRQIFPSVHQGIQINDIHRPTMWQRVAASGSFFERLPWTRDGRRLWHAIQPLQPDILTGVPTSYHEARAQKVQWCQRELARPVEHLDMAGQWFQHASVNQGRRVRKRNVATDSLVLAEEEDATMNVITCWSHNKHYESGPGHVLIDDCKKLEDAWVEKGGIFIHHEGNVDETIEQLYEHGILRE